MIDLILAGSVYVLALVVMVLLVIDEERDPDTTLAWLIMLFALPGVGLVLYFFVGRNWRRISQSDRIKAEIEARSAESLGPTYDAYREDARALVEELRDGYADRLIGIIEAQCNTIPLPAREVRVLTSGAEKFELLLADLSLAGCSIHLQYFIWRHDELTSRVTSALEERLAAGVEVRILYDFVGSMRSSNRELNRLKARGAHVVSNVRSLAKLNYRDHLKIAVIDGEIAYTGGMNMGQEYVDGGRRFDSWRDTHVRMTGPFVAEIQRLFAACWYEQSRESLFEPRYFPPPGGGVSGPMLQLVHSSVHTRWEAVRQAYLLAIAKAEERVRIQSPYLVPDKGIFDALLASALSGVDVRIMMTGVPDKRIAFWAAHAYYPRLLEAGVRIYQYEAGFFHVKCLTVDGEVAAFGTTNFDIRSFSLHNELSVFAYDRGLAALFDEGFERDLVSCREITAADLAKQGAWERYRNAAARLSSRLL